jgi:hypothetical protein
MPNSYSITSPVAVAHNVLLEGHLCESICLHILDHNSHTQDDGG